MPTPIERRCPRAAAVEPDEALYLKLIAGDVAAFERLYERYERSVFGFVRAQLGSDHEAEDVTHEAFLAVLHAGSASLEVRSFGSWLFQVARNLCRNRVRSRRRADRALEQAALEQAALEQIDVPARDRERETSALRLAVTRLPAPLAEVYQLRANGLSYEELAAALELPIGTIKSRIHETIRRLRARVRKADREARASPLRTSSRSASS
ncbi:MAG: polymerase, sigma-24 subunit, subfamily [Deltaproteobacteria bacterium]|nr:polymerase, sigma-24 subunit, subfamily [Deltaproteobacteria bacterium]